MADPTSSDMRAIDSDTYPVLYETPTLQKDGTRGKQFWRGEVIETDTGIAHRTDSWALKNNDEEGKHRISKPTYVEKKNVGKANETTLEEQAISEMDSKYEKKLDRRYWPVGEEKPDFQLTVRYQNLTDDGLPRFPVGIAIRNYE